MNDFLHGKLSRGAAKIKVPLLITALGIFALLVTAQSLMDDTDGDGIDDAFERFFGLDAGVDDSAANPDSDELTNLGEFDAGTDPFNPDTDLDGWTDGTDMNPVSRAVYLWGQPCFTFVNTNLYPRPAWAGPALACGGAAFAGGVYSYGWAVDGDGDTLLMGVNRDVLSNDLWLAVAASGQPASAYEVSVLDSNLVAVAEPVGLADSESPWMTNLLHLSACPDASVIAVRSTQGVAVVVASVLYADADGDGLDDDQNLQLFGGQVVPVCTNGMVSGVAAGVSVCTNPQPEVLEWIGFEPSEGYSAAPLDGQSGWTATEGVAVSDADAYEGSQNLILSRNAPGEVASRTAVKNIGAGISNGICWVSMRMKCVPNGPRLPRGQIGAAAFVVDSAGHVVAFDGTRDEWVSSAQTFPDAVGRWVRVDFCLDYVSKTYALCFEGVAVHVGLGFADISLSCPNRLFLRNDSAYEGGDAKADAVCVSADEPAGLDFDGDGLSNWLERQAGTDEWSSDSDGDGLSDRDEMEMGFDPLINNTDYDGDGLTNAEEETLGTDPSKSDSDGDGTADLYPVASVTGVEASHLSGDWGIWETAVVGLGYSVMRAEYKAAAPSAGIHRLMLELSNATNSVGVFRLQVSVDGVPVRWLESELGPSARGVALDTPWLEAGEHTFRIAWLDASYANKWMTVHALSLFGFDAPDADSDGIQDWMAARLLAEMADSDGDGIGDAEELSLGTVPLLADTDGDTLADGEEISVFGTEPLAEDSDSDGVGDTSVVAAKDGSDTSFRRSFHITAAWTVSGTVLSCQTGNAECYYDLVVPTNGGYRFGISLRNGQSDPPDGYEYQVAVTVDGIAAGTATVRADCDVSGTGWVTVPWLQAGTRRFGLRWKNDSSILTRPTSICIEGVELRSVDAPDADGDGVPDWVESMLQSKGDTDGDGLSDAAEVLVHGTNPLSKDTDGDGLYDGQETGTYHTDPLGCDSDGDGTCDGEEVALLGTDPLAVDIPAAFDTVAASAAGFAAFGTAGEWYPFGTELRCVRRGSAEYRITAPSAGIFAVAVEAALSWVPCAERNISPVTSAELLLYVDGLYLGRVKVNSADSVADTVRLFTPCLSQGTHTVKVFYNNLNSEQRLHLRRVSLMAAAGPDADGDGIADWANAVVAARSSLDDIAGGSYVSPACIEGRAMVPGLMQGLVSGGNRTVPVDVKAGVAGRWYADVPLCPTGAVSVVLGFENGAASASAALEWKSMNLAQPAGDLVVRPGDSIRVTCAPVGAAVAPVAVEAQGAGAFVAASDSAAVVTFAEPGSYRVTATYQGETPVSGYVDVTVVGGAFPAEPPACMPTVARLWAVPDVGDGTVMEGDAGLTVAATPTNFVSLKLAEPYGNHRLVLRTRAGGAVLDSVAVAGFWMQASPESYCKVVQSCEGYELWQADLVQWGLPSGVDVVLSTIVTGVMFDDYALTRTMTSSGFDGSGQYIFRLIHPDSVSASACHTVKVYQNGVFVGEAWYAGTAVPEVLK